MFRIIHAEQLSSHSERLYITSDLTVPAEACFPSDFEVQSDFLVDEEEPPGFPMNSEFEKID